LGFALAGLTALAFGLYMVPRRFSRSSSADFSTCMGIGIAVTLAVPVLAGAGVFVLRGFLLALGSGVVFALATHLFVLAVDRLGLTRATPVKNLAGIFGTLFGLTLLGEYRGAGSALILELVAGSLLIAAGAYLIGGMTGSREELAHNGRADATGFALALVSAACFGFYLVPLRLAVPLGSGFGYLGVGLGALAGLGLPHLRRGPICCSARDFSLGVLSGVLLAAGVLLGTPATRLIGLSVAWPLAQLNTFVALGAALVWLHEFDAGRWRLRLTLASLFTVVGIGLLALL
jgi:glucose uptake protein GlcU